MNSQKAYQISFILIVILFYSCGKDSSCFKGSGKTITEQREISYEITNIKLEDKIDLVLAQASVPSLTLVGGGNLLPYIETTFDGSEITIKSNNKCGFLRDINKPLTVYLSLPNITRIEYYGFGSITNSGNLNLKAFDFESFGGTGSINLNMDVDDVSIKLHSGPADITIKGNSTSMFLYVLGNGWVYFKDFLVKDTRVIHNGIGDVNVNAIERLWVELRSRGDLIYYGNPSIEVPVHTGDGEIRKQ